MFTDQEAELIDLSGLLQGQRKSRHLLSQYFALRVRGDSMIEALIDDGDLIILTPPTDAAHIKNGTIAAARVESKTTLKYYDRCGRMVILKPANPSYPATPVNAADVQIQGVLVGVIRGLVG